LLAHSPLAAQEDSAAGELAAEAPPSENTAGEPSLEMPNAGDDAKGFFSYFSLSFGMSVLFFPESDNLNSDPMPILPSPHLSLGFPFAILGTTALSVETSLDVYMTHYAYSTSLQRPVPAAIENRSSLVIGPMTGFQLQGKTGIGPILFVRYFLGLNFDLRIILIAEDLNENDLEKASNHTQLTSEYFWSKGRWFFPFAGAGIDFKTSPGLSFGLDGRVWFPVYKSQTNEDLPGLDGWRFGVGFRVTFLNETPDKIISRDIDRIKKEYAVEENDYAFILYHLNKNPPLRGIEPARLAEDIAKTYKHSGLYKEERAGITSEKITGMFTDVPAIDKDFSYDAMANMIRKN
jgi:hypothetical protein